MSLNASEPTESLVSDPARCAIEAFGVVKVAVDEIAALRKAPGPLGGRVIAPSLLKHADHQTVLAIASVLKAIDNSGWHGRSFDEWGLIAAPRFLGRINVAASMDRFQKRGVPSMSPLIIPTLSLHAVAGSLSLAIKVRGFNYGVGGGHGHLADALLAGLAAREDNGVPGVWVVVSQFSPEPVLDVSGHSLIPSFGYGLALAVTATAPSRSRWNLRVVSDVVLASADTVDDRDVAGIEPPTGLVALAEFLSATSSRVRRWYCPLPGGGALELDDDQALAGRSHGGAHRLTFPLSRIPGARHPCPTRMTRSGSPGSAPPRRSECRTRSSPVTFWRGSPSATGHALRPDRSALPGRRVPGPDPVS